MLSIPVVADVERNVDGIEMIRCSYYSIQSDTPIPNWNMNAFGTSIQILLLNLEAILVGPTHEGVKFRDVADIESMYDFAEQNEGLFVDINDIWIPSAWFSGYKIEQGFVYRISQDNFTLCWQLRNSNISSEEFIFRSEFLDRPNIRLSEEETVVLRAWTKKQINKSQEIYQENRNNYLQKIKK